MKRIVLPVGLLLIGAIANGVVAQSRDGGGGGSPIPTGSSFGGTFAPTTNQAFPTTSSFTQSTFSSGQAMGGSTTTGLQGQTGQSAVAIRQGFLSPKDGLGFKKGFLLPSNTQAATGARTTSGRTGTGGLGSLGALSSMRSGLGGFGSQFGTGRQSTTGSTTSPLRVPMRVASTTPTTRTSTVISSQFQERVGRLPGFDTNVQLNVQMEGGTAVLLGTVASDHQREMVARLALLEPGVSGVRNELQVDATRASLEVLPPGTPSAP